MTKTKTVLKKVVSQSVVHTVVHKQLLKKIQQVWDKFPNLRFCQMIGNCFEQGDNYYRSDVELLKSLYSTYTGVKTITRTKGITCWRFKSKVPKGGK